MKQVGWVFRGEFFEPTLERRVANNTIININNKYVLKHRISQYLIYNQSQIASEIYIMEEDIFYCKKSRTQFRRLTCQHNSPVLQYDH